MEIENVFEVGAPPDRVYAFLLDVEHIVGCVPGAELVETVDDNTFKGRVRIKVGPITVSYTGNAEIADRNAESHTAVLKASGRETTGSGSARATANMSVNAKGGGSEVRFVTEFSVAGRVANFGRGVMEDVSRRLVGQMANCIKANLEVDDAASPEPAPSAPPAEEGPGASTGASGPMPQGEPPPAASDETPEGKAPEEASGDAPASEPPAAEAPAAATPPEPSPAGAEPPHEAAVPPAAPMGGITAP
ncbi:MAG: SRPBCC family protein, partial [Candidatus Dormibacteraeota bacterium]|nr:SRPBCC family protein [Candidatus Dormibacteraeota bacterium]